MLLFLLLLNQSLLKSYNPNELIEWVEGNKFDVLSSETFGADYFEFGCAIDGMVHLDKENMCISKSNSEQTPYQLASRMKQIFGMSIKLSNSYLNDNANIFVNNIKSNTGRVLGIIEWFKRINIPKQFNNKLEYTSIPNHLHEACAFGISNGKYVCKNNNCMDEYYDTCTQFKQFITNIYEQIKSNPCQFFENKNLYKHLYLNEIEKAEAQNYVFQKYSNDNITIDVIMFCVGIQMYHCISFLSFNAILIVNLCIKLYVNKCKNNNILNIIMSLVILKIQFHHYMYRIIEIRFIKK